MQVRNHILARWRADPTQYLSEEDAASKILPKHRHLVLTAWRFLDHHGYINWGVAPAIMGRPAQEHDETVVVIGAGLAGTCRTLAEQPLHDHIANMADSSALVDIQHTITGCKKAFAQ